MPLVAGLGVVVVAFRGDDDAEVRLSRLKAAGYPTDLVALDAWYAAVPESENAALAVMDIIPRLLVEDPARKSLPGVGTNRHPARDEPWSPDLLNMAHGYLSNLKPDLQSLHAVLEQPRARYPIDLTRGVATLLPHLSKVKSAANVLQLHAGVAAERGETNEAVSAVHDILRLALTLEEEPLLLSHLVAAAIRRIGIIAAEQVFARVRCSETDLAALQAELHRADSERSLERSLMGEMIQAVAATRAPAGSLTEMLTWSTDTDTWEGRIEATQLWAYCVLKLPHRDRRILVRHYDDLLATLGRPESERWPLVRQLNQQFEQDLQARYLPLARMMGGVGSSQIRKHLEQIGYLRAARVGCAVERFRVAHGTLPAALEELVPQFLDAIPADPVDGRPLKFRRLERGYVVYSVGEDGTDHGGLEYARRPKGQSGGWDYTFTVER